MRSARVKTFLLLSIIATAVCVHARSSFADELVKFGSAPYVLGKIQQRLRGETAATPTQVIEGYLSKPAGDGPFPAVIYLHGCGGLSKGARKRFSELFTGWGYAALAVDSFATRGIDEACDHPMPDRQADAWGAMLYLSQLPFIDRNRIAVVGSSQGGIITLDLVSRHDVPIFDIPDGLNFKAAVAFYPTCSVASQQLTTPTIILIGEQDDWTTAKNCEQWMGLRSGGGAPVKLVVYPGAYHDFDVPGLRDGERRYGHWLKYDPDAAQKSTVEMHDFLAAQLR